MIIVRYSKVVKFLGFYGRKGESNKVRKRGAAGLAFWGCCFESQD